MSKLSPPEPLRQMKKGAYKSVKGDQVDEYIASIYNQKDLTLPIYRISEGTYLIGTEKKKCTIKGSNCLVRVGGGY